MKRHVIIGLAILIYVLVSSMVAIAAAPQLISYQGFLTSGPPSDNPITGMVDITFSIWDQGSGGSMKWSEAHANVDVKQGRFTVLLGSVDPVGNPLRDSVFNQPARISPQEVYDKIKSGASTLLVCAYAKEKYDASHLEGAISLDNLESRTPHLSMNAEIVFY